MRYLNFILLLVFLSACGVKPEPKKEVVVKECAPAKVVYKEKIVKEVCEKPEPCAVCLECPKPKQCKVVKPIVIHKGYEKLVIGEKEEVYFPTLDLSLEARIDTGATTTSVDARNIVSFERDGKKWVRFEMLKKDGTVLKVKRPLVKKITIKRHGEAGQERFVVKMRLNIASVSYFIEVSLTDRSQYKLPILVGRNFLKGNVIVDVALQNTKSPIKDNK